MAKNLAGKTKSSAKAKTAAPRKAAPRKAAPKKSVESEPEPAPDAGSDVPSERSPHAERGMSAIVCAQCDSTIDSGSLRIVLAAGEALHPGCTFGWTLDHFTNTTATADWMATMMQRSQLSPDDRAELLEELGAPSA